MEISECPQCGAAAFTSDRKCGYCKAEFFVTSLAYLGSFNADGVGRYLKHYKQIVRSDPENAEGLLGLGLCYLQMGAYPLSLKFFEQVIETSPDVAQAYYYLALACVRGRRLMTLSLNEVRRIEVYLNTASQLDGGMPQCKLLMAMVKRDYYETNGMKVSGTCVAELLLSLRGHTIPKNELDHLRAAVRVEKEEQYYGVVNIG